MNATERDDNFTRAKLSLLAPDLHTDADRAAAIEDKAGRERSGDDRQVAAVSGWRIEITDRCRGPLLWPVAHGHCPIAVAEIRVHVGDKRNLAFLRELVHGLRQWRPVFHLGAPDRH